LNKILQNTFRIFIPLSLICLLLANVSALAQQNATSKLLGAWQREADGQQYVITFKADGSGTLENGNERSIFQWKLQGNTLTLEGSGGKFIHSIMITAETLTMMISGSKSATWNRIQ
jgi:hypothetical protein